MGARSTKPASRRMVAWILDVLLTLGLGSLVPPVGWALSLAYWLGRDALFNGQSVGKRLMGLRVVVGPRRTPCTLKDSIVRNVLWAVPLVNLLIALNALITMAKDPQGRHWGDRLADSRVAAV